MLIMGHFVLLWGDTQTALTVKLIGGLCVLPFAFSLRLWDVIILELTFGGMDFTKLMQLLFS